MLHYASLHTVLGGELTNEGPSGTHRVMPRSPVDSPPLFPASEGPDLAREMLLQNKGYRAICGVDEAGRGPLAGPVTAAAVILDVTHVPEGLNDSKKLKETRRNELFDEILMTSIVSVAHVGAQRIDQLNIREASLLAMANAVRGLSFVPDYALIDGNALPRGMQCEASAIIKGDARSLSIAAASIVAKVMRDRLMVRMDAHYPKFGFAGHKGYPTQAHRAAIAQFGPSPLHRQSFAPVREAAAKPIKNPPFSEKGGLNFD